MQGHRKLVIAAAIVGSAAVVLATAPWASADGPAGGATAKTGGKVSSASVKTGAVNTGVTDDSYTDPGYPLRVNGATNKLTAQPSGGKTAYLRFNVSGVPDGAEITSATVSLSRMGFHNIPPLDVYGTPTTWNEATLNAANAPTPGALVGKSATTDGGQTATLDVKSLAAGNGVFSIALKADTPGSIARIESSEFVGAGIPKLAVAWSVTTPMLLTGADTVTGQFSTANSLIGPLHAVRLFYSGALPDDYAKVGVPAGVVAFISYKTPSTNTVPFAKSCPPGTRVIFHHEPENEYGGNGAAFVAQYNQEYTTLKTANPDLLVGMAAMSYQYAGGRYGQSGTFLPPADHVDFYAVDNYESKPTGAGLATDAPFMGWYNLVKGRGKPLVFAEYGVGVNPVGSADQWSAKRAATMIADRTWLINHPGFTGLLYWYNTGARGDWRFHDAASITAWKTLMTL
jgi:hypothetical protein